MKVSLKDIEIGAFERFGRFPDIKMAIEWFSGCGLIHIEGYNGDLSEDTDFNMSMVYRQPIDRNSICCDPFPMPTLGYEIAAGTREKIKLYGFMALCKISFDYTGQVHHKENGIPDIEKIPSEEPLDGENMFIIIQNLIDNYYDWEHPVVGRIYSWVPPIAEKVQKIEEPRGGAV